MKMARYTEFVGRTTGVVIDADTWFVDWTPKKEGRLKKIIVICGGIAATTLIENGHVKLSSADFGGVDQYAPFDAGGVFTAPHLGKQPQITECDLKVTRSPIAVSYYYNVIPTTPELVVYAEIEA